MVDLKRRNLFKGRGQQPLPARPPGAITENEFIQSCTRCRECIDACETQIIKPGSGGFPEVDFSVDECTFCQACIQSCETGALNSEQKAFFRGVIQINESCLTYQGVACRSCEDSCEPEAIHFQAQLGSPSQPKLNLDTCTRCGACVSRCPSSAISYRSSQ